MVGMLFTLRASHPLGKENVKADTMCAHSSSPRPLIFGEVLFDCFGPDRTVIGGAPFNVAWSLKGFGHDPAFLSAVGRDPLGQRALETATRWGLETHRIPTLDAYPTGRVDVRNAETDPEYEFQDDCAWDHLAFDPDLIPADAALLYHGSLATRAEASRAALEVLRTATDLPRFVDLNLRPPHYDSARLPGLVKGATWLKLNTAELEILVADRASPKADLATRAHALTTAFGIQHVLVTDGARGAFWISAESDEVHFAPAPRADPFVDSVGAGDAFSSVVIHGIIANWKPAQILKNAVAFAARVCSHQGATVETPKFYEDERKSWK